MRVRMRSDLTLKSLSIARFLCSPLSHQLSGVMLPHVSIALFLCPWFSFFSLSLLLARSLLSLSLSLSLSLPFSLLSLFQLLPYPSRSLFACAVEPFSLICSLALRPAPACQVAFAIVTSGLYIAATRIFDYVCSRAPLHPARRVLVFGDGIASCVGGLVLVRFLLPVVFCIPPGMGSVCRWSSLVSPLSLLLYLLRLPIALSRFLFLHSLILKRQTESGTGIQVVRRRPSACALQWFALATDDVHVTEERSPGCRCTQTIGASNKGREGRRQSGRENRGISSRKEYSSRIFACADVGPDAVGCGCRLFVSLSLFLSLSLCLSPLNISLSLSLLFHFKLFSITCSLALRPCFGPARWLFLS